MRISNAARPVALLLVLAAMLPACRTVQVSGEPGVGATMVIERFLRAANQNDLDTMASLFGTTEGPVAKNWPKKEQDDRMFLLASVLRHTDYTIGSEQIVPGRREVAVMYNVTLTRGDEKPIVPFRMLRHEGSWLVENICIERVSQGPEAPCRG